MDHEQHHEQPHLHGHGSDHGGANVLQWQNINMFSSSSPRLPSPVNGYSNFNMPGLPVEPMYGTTQPARASHQRLEPLIMPQWPSMLINKSNYATPLYSSAPITTMPPSTPLSSNSSRTPSTPRKTLTDDDRRQMCVFHEKNPNVKQTEIGARFGVERSTVSKVLRQKDKYLNMDERSRSPMKRTKGKFPDVERALANWAKNHVRQGLQLSDAMIQEQARVFASTVGHSEGQLKNLSSSWLEKFKQKYGIESRWRKNSAATTASENETVTESVSERHDEISPLSPTSTTTMSIPAGTYKEVDVRARSTHEYHHNQSQQPPNAERNYTPSSKVFADNPTKFHADSNVQVDSPISEPQNLTERFDADGENKFSLQIDPSAEQLPNCSTETGFAPTESAGMPRTGMTSMTPAISLQTNMPPPRAPSMNHTPLSPSSGGGLSATRGMTPDSSPQSPSQDDARRALELVIDYCQNQPTVLLEPQDYMAIGRLMEKLNLHRQQQQQQQQASPSQFQTQQQSTVNGCVAGGVGLGLSVSPHVEQLPGGMVEIRKMENI